MRRSTTKVVGLAAFVIEIWRSPCYAYSGIIYGLEASDMPKVIIVFN